VIFVGRGERICTRVENNKTMISSISLFMMLLAGGASNDLLDYVPTEAYFKAAKVELSVPALTESLKAEEDALFGNSAQRQMALRALGELGDAAALPAIAKYAEAKNPLVASYARAAQAAIEGKKYQRPGVSEDDLRTDLACLPSGVGVIGRIKMGGGGAVDIVKQIVAMGLDDLFGDMEDPAEAKTKIEAQILAGLGGVIARLGNFRVNALTFGVAAEVGPDANFVVVLVRGIYDHDALSAMLGESIDDVRREAGGLTYYDLLSGRVHVAPVSDELLVLIAGTSVDTSPLAEVGAKVIAGGGDFTISKTLAKLLDEVDLATPLWILLEVTESYKKSPFLKPFDTVRLWRKNVGDKFKLNVMAEGSDAAAVGEVVDELNEGLNELRKQIDQTSEEHPSSKMVLAMFKSAVLTTDETSAKFEIDLPGDGGVEVLLPMLWLSAPVKMEAGGGDAEAAGEPKIRTRQVVVPPRDDRK